MEPHPLLAAQGADFAHRLEDADLVVGGHDAHQHGLGEDGGAQLVEVDQAVGPRRQHRGAAALVCEAPDGVEHGPMLGRHGDDVGALRRGRPPARP